MQDLGSLSVRLGKGGGLGSFNVGSGQGGMSCVVSPLCLSAVFNPLQMDDALRSSLLLRLLRSVLALPVVWVAGPSRSDGQSPVRVWGCGEVKFLHIEPKIASDYRTG